MADERNRIAIGGTIYADYTGDDPVLDSVELAGFGDVETEIEKNSSNTLIRVKQASDFGVIDSTKVYLIDGIIDMGSTSVEVPAGGINIIGYTFDTSQLVSSENAYDMFYSAVGGSGNILATQVAFEASGTGSQVFNLTSATGFDAFEFTVVNFNNCTKIGVIDGYRQGLESGTGRFGGTPELELVGTWVGGYFINTSIVRALDDGVYSLYKAGAGFSMASRFRSNQNIDLPANVSFFDFAGSNFVNPSTLQLDGCIITRDGSFDAEDANITPNILASNLVCTWKQNQGIPNTFVGGLQTVTTEATTTVSVIDTFYDVAGTFTATELEHFDEPANGQLRHLGINPREYRIYFDAIVDGSPNRVVTLRLTKWDDSSSSFVSVGEQIRQVNSFVGGRDVAFFNYSTAIILDQNDYIMLQVANNTDTQNITMEENSTYRIEQR